MVKRRRFPFGFGLFDDDFSSDLFEEIERMMKEMQGIEPTGRGKGRSFVWGFNAKMDPEGKWRVEEFGNKPITGEVRGKKRGISEEREPLIDIIEDKHVIRVIAELPGVSKEQINLKTDEGSLEIKVSTPERKYYKSVKLPTKIKTTSVKASYKNGVLEVILERQEPKKEEKGAGHRVRIE